MAMQPIFTPLAARHPAQGCTNCSFRTAHHFCRLGDDAFHRLEQIGTRVALPRRAVVFKQSQPANRVFLVCEGQLKLSATSQNGRVMILRLVGNGDVLGLSAALNNVGHEVTAETLEPTTLKSVRRADFLEFLQAYAEVGLHTSQVLAKQHREVFLDARRLALSGSAPGRLARLLLDWSVPEACSKPENRLTMVLTHEELANMVGTSRETVTRLLNQFERDGFILRDGNTIVILSPEKLNLLAG